MSVPNLGPIQIDPNPGESYRNFVFRAHNSLIPSISNPDQRNSIVWNSWSSRNGDSRSDQAKAFFSSDKYQCAPNVCLFMEHSIQREDNSTIDYDFNELSRIVEAANQRCDTNSYSAIASHHTNRDEKGPDKEPKVIGYAGPYRLGMVNSQDPKWAIFADEYHDNRYSRIFDERRRRSVEVMRPKNGDPSWFDPIATLGADSPRLPLPIARYQSSSDEVEHFYYSMPSNFVGVGQGNTFIPSHMPDQPKRDHYQSENSSMSPEDVNMIVMALMNTPEMKWVSEQMESSRAPLPNASQPPSLPGQNGTPHSHQQPSPNLSVPAVGGSGFQQQRYSAGHGQEEELDHERYSAIESELLETRDQYSQLQSQYQELAAANAQNMQTLAKMNASIAGMEQATIDAERTSRVRDLYAAYPNVVDLEEELAAVLYSRGNSMDNETFNQRCSLIEKVASRSSAPTQMLPDGVFRSPANPGLKNAEAVSAEVISRYSRGDKRSFEAIKADVEKEWGSVTA